MDQFGDQAQRPIYTCVRCNTLVPPENDTFEVMTEWLNFKFSDGSQAEPFCAHYHFLPVYDGDKKICSGSKSTAQYIEGQPRDDRGDSEDAESESDYQRNVQRMREAYKRVQVKFATRT